MKSNLEEEFDKSFEAKYQEYEASFEQSITSGFDIREKIEEIDSLIEHVNSRVTYTESRITRAVTISLSLVGFGMAFLVAAAKLSGLAFYLGISISLSFVLTGLIASYIHTRQVNPRYPFRKLKNDWKWFYPQVVDEKYGPSMLVKEKEEAYFKKRLLHIEDMKAYSIKLLNEDDKERVKVDLQQLFLLHVNEKYKNCFLSSITQVIKIGVAITAALFIALAITLAVKRTSSLDVTGNQAEHNMPRITNYRTHPFHHPHPAAHLLHNCPKPRLKPL